MWGRVSLKQDLASFPINSVPWSKRYPQLLTLLEKEPMAPVENIIRSNVFAGAIGTASTTLRKKRGVIENNLVDAPHFVNATKGDYRLRNDSPAFALGFDPIPYDQIGCYQSPDRASWPVHHTVRPADAPQLKPK